MYEYMFSWDPRKKGKKKSGFGFQNLFMIGIRKVKSNFLLLI